MNGCTETDKPLISIVMAVYEPNLQWFREQLDSLEAQTYPNLELLVIDDCSPTVPFETVQQYIAESIRSFPYQVQRNEKNLGSNGTFEKLTQQARGKYIAYCDQDDVWLPEKLEILQKTIEQTGAKLVCSDMYIIDGQGKQAANSITKVRRHHVFHSGDNLAEGLLFRNFVTGCTILMPTEIARQAIPFCPYMVHDHYLALYAALHGAIQSVMEPLIRYRIHGNNQTGLLAGITDKQSYGYHRIDLGLRKLEWLNQNLKMSEEVQRIVQEGLLWMDARKKYSEGDRHMLKVMWKYRGFSPFPTIFEIVMGLLPERFFMFFIHQAQRNKI